MFEVIDNFLEPDQHAAIQKELLGTNFPWFYNDHVSYQGETHKNSQQFTHIFYKPMAISNHIGVLESLYSKIDPFMVLRIKANLNLATEEMFIHGLHCDYDGFFGKTAVYYVNTNNGKTIFEDGTTIDSVANRLLIFDANLFHSGTTCTDEKVRCVINLNFFEKNKIYKPI